jgi:glycosyltransferase involved in cell wall biosynthesis
MRLLIFNLATDADDPILGFTTHWVRALAKRVEFVHVITMRAGHIAMPSNVRVHSVGKERGYSEPRRAIQLYRHLLGVLHEGRVDVCFSHMIPIFTVLAAPILKAKGIPIVMWFAHPSLTWTLKFAHHFSDRVVTSVAAAYPYRRDKLTVIGQGIDTNLFSLDNSLLPEDPPLILCVGRLSPVKDHPTLLSAVSLLRQRWRQPFRVAVLGGPATHRDESYVQSLHKQVQELGLQDVVSFKPPVPMEVLPAWYRRSSILVNMTPTGSGDKVAWESMSSGKTCLVANEGFSETLGKYVGCLLFRYGDPDDLANKLQMLLTLSKGELDWIGLYLRQQVVRMHSLDRLADNLTAILQAVARCSKGPSSL